MTQEQKEQIHDDYYDNYIGSKDDTAEYLAENKVYEWNPEDEYHRDENRLTDNYGDTLI